MSPLTVLFEDEYLVAIDKPAGLLVHPAHEHEGPEWIAMKRLRDQLGRLVFPVHRLDRPTSGVLLFALDKQTAGLIQQTFERRQVMKVYQAVVCGLTPAAWICETPLRPSPADAPQTAKTGFERLDVTPASFLAADPALILSLLKAMPATGRFHQIRRHLLEAGFPIVGDFRYAEMQLSHALGETLGIGTRMLLQAKSLTFNHPYTGNPLHIQAPDDVDFLKCFPSGNHF